MKLTSLKAALLVGAMAVAAGGVAMAQTASQAPASRQEMRERPDPAAMAEHRAQKLRDVLQLTPRQEPALKEFMASTKPPEGGRERFREGRQEMAGLPTPERLDRMKARMAEREARFEQRASAVKRFYAQLTPAQQKAFDALRPAGGRGHGMGGHGKGRMDRDGGRG